MHSDFPRKELVSNIFCFEDSLGLWVKGSFAFLGIYAWNGPNHTLPGFFCKTSCIFEEKNEKWVIIKIYYELASCGRNFFVLYGSTVLINVGQLSISRNLCRVSYFSFNKQTNETKEK